MCFCVCRDVYVEYYDDADTSDDDVDDEKEDESLLCFKDHSTLLLG